MKKLISFLALVAIVGVIGCDSLTGSDFKPIVNKDTIKQFMNPESLQHYLPEKKTPGTTKD